MKSIEVLIKIKKKELDEKRLQISELETQKNQMLDYSEQMKVELKSEEEFASRDPYSSITFDSYRNKIKERQQNISVAVKDIKRQADIINHEMAEIFNEMKKYEIILERKLEEAKIEQKAKDEKALNEIAINNYLENMD